MYRYPHFCTTFGCGDDADGDFGYDSGDEYYENGDIDCGTGSENNADKQGHYGYYDEYGDGCGGHPRSAESTPNRFNNFTVIDSGSSNTGKEELNINPEEQGGLVFFYFNRRKMVACDFRKIVLRITA